MFVLSHPTPELKEIAGTEESPNSHSFRGSFMLPIVEVGLSMTAAWTCGSTNRVGKTFFCSVVPRGGALVMAVPLCGTCTFEVEDVASCFGHS